MGKRLPPGEAERRAAERHRATFSGEKYKRYDPDTEGYGSYEQWAALAAAFLNGDVVFEIETDAKPEAKPTAKKKKSSNPDLAILDLDAMPIDFNALKKGYRAAAMTAFQEHGSNDRSEQYVNAFRRVTIAFENIKRQKGWR